MTGPDLPRTLTFRDRLLITLAGDGLCNQVVGQLLEVFVRGWRNPA